MRKQPVRSVICAALFGAGALAMPAEAKVSDVDAYVMSAAAMSPDGAGDLDGDGRDDLLTYRITKYDDDTALYTLSAVRGSNGKRIWSRNGYGDSPVLLTMRLGSPARPAVLMRGDGEGGEHVLGAFDGRTGKKLWSSSATMWGYSYGYTSHQAYRETGRWAVLPAAKDKAARIVFRGDNGRPIVVNGEDGSHWQPSLETVLSHGWDFVEAIDDVDGDGYADFAVTGGYLGTRAYSSTTGEELWGNLDLSGAFVRLRDVTGDKARDLLFSGRTVVDGATGAQVYAVPNGVLHPAGDVNGDGLADLTHVVSASGRARGNSASYTLTARLGPDGKPGWQRVVKASGETTTARFAVTTVADLDGDRIVDFGIKRRNPPEETAFLVVDGESGRLRQLPKSLGDPLGYAVDGRGEDFVKQAVTCLDPCRRQADLTSTVRVVDGRSARTMLVTRFSGYVRQVFATHATRDAKAELVVSWSVNDDHWARAYDGDDLRPRWTIKV